MLQESAAAAAEERAQLLQMQLTASQVTLLEEQQNRFSAQRAQRQAQVPCSAMAVRTYFASAFLDADDT